MGAFEVAHAGQRDGVGAEPACLRVRIRELALPRLVHFAQEVQQGPTPVQLATGVVAHANAVGLFLQGKPKQRAPVLAIAQPRSQPRGQQQPLNRQMQRELRVVPQLASFLP